MDDWDWEVLLHDSSEVEKTEIKDEQQPRIYASSCSSDEVGVIRSDYFSLDSHQKFVGVEEDEESSDNPSWIDPSGSSIAVRGERISSSSSRNSDSSDPSDSRNLLLLIDTHSDCAFDSAVNGDKMEVSGEFHGSDAVDQVEGVESEEVVEQSYSNSSGSSVTAEVGGEGRRISETISESNEEKKVVWWKVPLEVLRYCVLRVSPVWSLSMAAAAIMGFVILRRRYLYKMKRKTQGLQLKVIVDDKKVSQFMSRAARLNEAFSVVKRVPIIRPSLPAPGLAPWPVVSMR
ncbi:uncharacterized protein LOC110739137 [Chenopodium quinoa]|uniref:uncharacterized protein LOC110739137 n=1 Tax=Chenopodium quinoa TaxID=63459 RepID=UPI000B78FF16|nr:uncharacterized protein LOC110739137 [Chenopodium quinoa]